MYDISYLNGMYVCIDREEYEKNGQIKLEDSPVAGVELYRAMLKEDNEKFTRNDAIGHSRWLVSLDRLMELLELVGGKTGRVVGHLIRKSNQWNVCNCIIVNIANETGVSAQTVGKAISLLKQRGFIKKGQHFEYMLAPSLGYIGRGTRGRYLQNMYDRYGKKKGEG